MKTFLALIFLCMAIFSNAAQPDFSSSTEESTTGKKWFTPNENLIKNVLTTTSAEQQEQIKEYLVENKVSHARKLLAATKVRLCKKCKESYYFVRPASKYFSPWYGAHSFTYWLVRQDGEVIHSAAVDLFGVLNESSKSLYPIEQSICLTSKCLVTRLEFNGSAYSPVGCRTNDIANEKVSDGCN